MTKQSSDKLDKKRVSQSISTKDMPSQDISEATVEVVIKQLELMAAGLNKSVTNLERAQQISQEDLSTEVSL